MPPVSIPEQRSRSWILEALWRNFDQTNALCRIPGWINQTACRYLARSLKASVKEDRKRRAATASALAGAELNQGRITEAWNVIHRWFIKAEDWSLLPSRKDLRKVTNDCIKLYSKALQSDWLPILVAPFDIDDVVLEPDEILQAVCGLKNGKSP